MTADSSISIDDTFPFYVSVSPLIVSILGGNRQNDYRTDMFCKGILRDRDIQDAAND